MITIIVAIATIIAGFIWFILELCDAETFVIKKFNDNIGIFIAWLFFFLITSAGIIFLVVRFVKYVWSIY